MINTKECVIINFGYIFGNNFLPGISVNNMETLNLKLEGKEICFPLTKISNNWVVEFVDSKGNHIEMTTPA